MDYIEAIEVVLKGIRARLDPRKIVWCNYPAFWHNRDELEEKVEKDTGKLEREIGDELYLSKLWYVGIPRFKLIRRGIVYLNCEIDLYYVVSDDTNNHLNCWYGKIISKADSFDFPLSLANPLCHALSQGQTETDNAKIVERGIGYAIYDYLGREWKIPDAFLGFVWALKEKRKGFEGLLDPITCQIIDKFSKELPSPGVPKLPGDDYEGIVLCLKEQMGYPKTKAEEAAKFVLEKFPKENLEIKIKQALNYLSG